MVFRPDNGQPPHQLPLDGSLATDAPRCQSHGGLYLHPLPCLPAGQGRVACAPSQACIEIDGAGARTGEPDAGLPAMPQRLEPRTGSHRIKSGCDEAGNPTDPLHPWNKPRGGPEISRGDGHSGAVVSHAFSKNPRPSSGNRTLSGGEHRQHPYLIGVQLTRGGRSSLNKSGEREAVEDLIIQYRVARAARRMGKFALIMPLS